MSDFRTLPTNKQAIAKDGVTDKSWWRWFAALDQGQPPANETPVTLGASPFTYHAPGRGFALIVGGTVSAVQFSRASVHNTGQTAGVFPMSRGDGLTITFSGAPTVTFVPQ